MRRCIVSCLLAASLLGCASEDPPSEAPGDRVDAEPPAAAVGPPDRRFRIRYVAELSELPPGQPLRLWIPVPQDDAQQRIGEVRHDAPAAWSARYTRGPRYGNRMLYLEGETEAPEATITLEYEVERWEHRVEPASLAPEGRDAAAAMAGFSEGSRLVQVDEEIREAARGLRGETTLATARGFYDHVRAEMSYDKTGVGWGRGDSAYACSVGRGNCTDFHAYFMALCLAERIPSRFQIGLYGDAAPRPQEEYATGGYHCWALFRVPGRAWVPVDISEADKDPTQAEYFFGAHSPNRVTLSEGRDLLLEPAQAGEPLNYFLQPYCEVAGRAHPGVSKRSYWRDS